jgi:hypothetical protein
MEDLGDYNKDEINQIDECKKELLDISEEYIKLINKVSAIFRKIENIEFSKRVQNPCTNCIVKPACQFRQEVKRDGIPTMSMNMNMGSFCQPKIKSLIISKIKQEKANTYFVNNQTRNFHGDMIRAFLTSNQEEYIYPEWWTIEK